LPVSNLVLTIVTIMAERLMYLPSVAFVLLVGAAVHSARPSTNNIAPVLTAIAAGVAPVLMGVTLDRNRDWRSQEALFSHTVRQSPDSAKAHFNYGTVFLERQALAEAAREFRRAVQIAPDYPEAHNGLGNVHLRLRSLDEAEVEFREAIRDKPDLASAWTNLGITLSRMGRDGEAESALRRALDLDPWIAIAHANLGAVAERQGHLALAIDHYWATYRLEPQFEALGPHLVELLVAAGRHAEAEALSRELRERRGGP
jgi:Tfp pilus assembly protein PilF